MSKLIKDIDIITEKYLHGFKVLFKQVDIYENPTKKEQKEAIGTSHYSSLRFIVDGEKKRIWVWNADLAIHSQAWKEISKVIGDKRQLYKDHELISGEIEPDDTIDAHYVVDYGRREIAEMVLKMDWSWVDKYFAGFSKEFKISVKYEMRKKGWL